MTTDAFRSKKPFSPDAEVEELLRAWQTLDLTEEAELKPGQTNALNLRRPPVAKVAQPEEATPEYKPLTAEDMEQIRQAAYDEGFAEGKEEGFGKGYAEGRQQGLADGTAQGLAEGKKLGLSQAQQEIDNKLHQLTELLSQLQQPLSGLDQQVASGITELALAMAKAVIGVEVTTNPQVILQAVQEATSALPLQTEQMRIKLHPDDLAILQQYYSAEELQQRHWQLRAEPTIERGGCLVESEKSGVDRSLTQRVNTSLEHFLHQASISN